MANVSDPINQESQPEYWIARSRGPQPLHRVKHTDTFKLAVVRESFEHGVSVSVVARRHNVNANMLFRWRKEYRLGLLNDGQQSGGETSGSAKFIDIGVINKEGQVNLLLAPRPSIQVEPESPPEAEPAPTATQRPPQTSAIEIALTNGVVVRVSAPFDDFTVGRVLALADKLPGERR